MWSNYCDTKKYIPPQILNTTDLAKLVRRLWNLDNEKSLKCRQYSYAPKPNHNFSSLLILNFLILEMIFFRKVHFFHKIEWTLWGNPSLIPFDFEDFSKLEKLVRNSIEICSFGKWKKMFLASLFKCVVRNQWPVIFEMVYVEPYPRIVERTPFVLLWLMIS